MGLKRKLFWSSATLGVLVVVLVALGFAFMGGVLGNRGGGGMSPLAPNASEAPLAPANGRIAQQGGAKPECKWPDNFNLPVDIRVDTPDVPETIQSATAPETLKK